MHKIIRVVVVVSIAAVAAVSIAAQQPPSPAATASQGGSPPQGGPPAGGGRGAVSFNVSQGLALANMNVPQAAVQAVSEARNEIVRASLTAQASASDLQTKVDALAKAEQALAVQRATELARVGSKSLNLTPEQMTAIIANNGLPRGGNTSPGGTIEFGDYTGFTKIWDGKTFNGWNGETDAWTIVNDAIQMDVARKPGQHHIHFTGLPGVSPIVKDFDFKVEFKASAGNFNGGVQYRSRLLTGHGPNRSIFDPATIANPLGQPLPAGITTQPDANAAGIAGQPWQVSGYQFDITGNNMGSLYEGQGRGVIVNAGEIVQLFPGGLKYVIGRAADNAAQYTHPNNGLDGEWNQVEIIARGNTLVHILNGHVITVTTDDDPARRAFQGILSLQCEGGAIWYRNVYLKHLEPIGTAPATAVPAVAPQGPPQFGGPPPGGGGGRGGRGGLPGATPEQTAALMEMNTTLAPLVTAATAARTELAQAAVADAKTDATVKAAADKLRAAELAVATARADAFSKIQAGPNKLSAEQVTALINAGGNVGGGGRGGRGGGG